MPTSSDNQKTFSSPPYGGEAALVRAFFDAYFTGLLEARLPEGAKREPRLLKQLVAEQYGQVATTFTSCVLPIFLTLRFESYEAAVADMQARHFSDATPVKLLLRYACGSKETYDNVTATYRQQLETLLTGRIQSVEAFFAADSAARGSESSESSESSEPSESSENSENERPKPLPSTPALLRALARTVLSAYALGIRAGGGQSLRQPTVFRLVGDAAATLLHDKPIDVWADMDRIGLDGVYSRVCRTQDNYETLLAEMSQAYEDLANS